MKEDDELSKQRLEELRGQIAEQQQELDKLRAEWSNQKDAINRVREIKAQIDQAQVDEDRCTREGDLVAASEIRFGRIPQLKSELEEAMGVLEAAQEEDGLLKEEGTAEDRCV